MVHIWCPSSQPGWRRWFLVRNPISESPSQPCDKPSSSFVFPPSMAPYIHTEDWKTEGMLKTKKEISARWENPHSAERTFSASDHVFSSQFAVCQALEPSSHGVFHLQRHTGGLETGSRLIRRAVPVRKPWPWAIGSMSQPSQEKPISDSTIWGWRWDLGFAHIYFTPIQIICQHKTWAMKQNISIALLCCQSLKMFLELWWNLVVCLIHLCESYSM